MVTNTLVHCIEEAAEFGDRFPDVSDADVLNHVSEVCKLSAYLEEDWAISRCILQAYEFGGTTCTMPQAVEEGISTAKVWGLIPRTFDTTPINSTESK